MRTRVFITIDTEFGIGGAFEAPQRCQPIGAQNVLCEVNGRSEGLGFMLEAFRTYGIRATFFIEALQTAHFGDSPMGAIARRIADSGHDVQLHLHPVWTYFDYSDWQAHLARESPTDNIDRRTVEQLVGWMRRGIETFARWGLPAPVALRTGNLMVDRNVYRAMSKVGLKVASNVARAVFEPEEEALRFNAGLHAVDGVLELPVLTYAGVKLGSRLQLKSLTITGSSIAEIKWLLARAHALGCRSVVLLTHCHELVKGQMQGRLTPNRLNQSRLVALCRYLQHEQDRFEVATMDRMVMFQSDAGSTDDPLIRVPARLAVIRMIQNTLNDHSLN